MANFGATVLFVIILFLVVFMIVGTIESLTCPRLVTTEGEEIIIWIGRLWEKSLEKGYYKLEKVKQDTTYEKDNSPTKKEVTKFTVEITMEDVIEKEVLEKTITNYSNLVNKAEIIKEETVEIDVEEKKKEAEIMTGE